MIDDKTALIAEDGDCGKVVELLMSRSKTSGKNEKIRQQGLLKAREYNFGQTKQMPDECYSQLAASDKSNGNHKSG